MGILAIGSTSVIDVLDGVGISSSIIEYAVSSSGTQPPGNPITDGEGNPILDNEGKPLTDGEWSTTLPSVPEGQFLWTRTRLIRSDGSFDMIYTVSQNGSTGATGATITNQKEQYYLSSSPTQLTGGTWGYEEPNPIPTGKYLWGRFENIMSDGTVTYSTAVYRSTISGVINLTNEIDGKITQKIWQSDIDSTIEDYDNPTGTSSLRDRVTQTESDISGITQTVGQVQSTLATKADGSTVTTLQNDYSEFKQTMGGFKTTVESSYAQLTDVDNKIANIKVGGNNLYVIADEIPGYVTGTGVISAQDPTNKEVTSAYIPVQEGEDYIIQSWATPNASGESWLAYQFYANTTGTTVGSRQAKYGKDSNSGVTVTAEGQEHLSYSVKVPQNANYLRVSYRKFNDGYAMVEKATVPSEYSINTRDVEEMVNSIDIGVRNLLKEADIGTTPKTSKGITVDYEGNGWFHIYGTVTGTSNGLVCLYGSTSRTSNLISEPGEYTFSVYGDMNTNTDVKYQIATHSNTATNDTIASSMTLGANQQEMTFTLAEGYHVSRVAFYINDVATGDEVDLHVRMKLEKGNKSTDWTPAPEDTIAQISNTRTIAEQTADRFGWIVQDGSTQSSVQYTANALTAMANQIDLTGNVTFNSMSSIANNAINGLKAYVGTSSTAAGTATKVVDCTDTDFQLINGVTITITFSTANTADALKLNVKSTGEKAVYYDTAVTSQNNRFRWQANSVITFQYDGTNWVVLRYETREYFACSTAKSTEAKVTNSATGSFILCKGTTVNVYFSKANTANATTLNVGATGAFSIRYKNAATSASNQYFWDAGTTLTFTYNGSYWNVSDNGTQLVKDYAKTAVDWVGTNESIIDAWKGEAENNVTTINGGLIQSHTILAKNLATDAIMSNNYSTGVQNQNIPVYNSATNPYLYSNTGTFLDLASGNIYSPNFTLINQTPANTSTPVGTYLNGTITATAGRIGEAESSYWEIGTTFDDSWNDTAAIIAHGSAAIETGTLTLSNARLNSLNSGDYIQYGTGNDAKWYDYGLQVPNLAATGQDTYYNDFLFIRYVNTKPDEGTLNSDWNYLFRVDKDGFIYENGQPLSSRYAAIGDVEGAYVSTTGGTVNGNLTVTGTLTATASAAAKLSSSRNLNVNLATTSNDGKVAFDGSANVTLGIAGTLGVAHGGTGATTFASGQVLIGNNAGAVTTRAIRNNVGQGALGWTNSAVDNTIITTNTLAYWDGRYQTNNNASNIQYVRYGKLGTVVTHDVEEFITSSGGTVNGALTVTDLTAGNLVVNGGATFTNGLTGDLTGNVVGTASNATKVGNNLIIKLNGGTTEGTNMFTFNGSAAKTVNITKSNIGLGNVENTADADKNVLSAAQFTEAQTITLTGDTTGTVSSQAGWSIATQTKQMSILGTISGTDHAVALKTYFDANKASTPRNKPISFYSSVSGNGSVLMGYFLPGYDNSPYGGFFVSHYNNAYYVGIQNGTYTQQKIVTSTNYTDYTVTKTGGGATGSNWGISITGNAATATNATQADHVANSLTIQLNGGSTEGTNKFTYNGSGAKSFNITKSSIGLGNVTNNAQVKGLSSGTTSGHLVTWGSDGYTVADSGITKGNIVKSVASDSDGKLVLTYADDTTSDPIAVQFVASSASSVNIANSLNVGGTAVGSTSLPVYFTNQGKPAVITSLPKSYVGLGNVDNTADANKNVLSATKFASAQSITLTGDTTGTASSQAGWSIATSNVALSALNSSGEAQQGTANRPTTANVSFHDGKLRYFLATGSMTEGKPPEDCRILHFAWDNTGWDAQMAVSGGGNIYTRGSNGNGVYSVWTKLLNASNYTDYTVTKTGTGATGDWGINITGNATTATSATNDSAGNNISTTYVKKSGSTMTGHLQMVGSNLILGTSDESSNDSGDIEWLYGNGNEKMRIYSPNSPTVKQGPYFRIYDENGTSLYSGTLPLADGTGASGTWNISISGSATTTSQLTGIGANKFLIGQGTNSAVIGTSNMEYFNNENITIGSYTAKRNGLYIGGLCYGNDVNYITSSTAGEISFGDGGPQILFGDAASFSGSTQIGALIYTNNDTPSAGVSWHFVSNQSDWNVSSKRFTARTSVTIGAGTNKPNTSYNLHVTGTGYFTGAVTGTSFAADIIQTKTNTSTTTGGLALYSNGNPMIYGIAMRGTGTTSGEGGTHGYVTGNWAIYHSIAGGGSDRGWILRNSTTSANVASVSNAGHAVFNGSVTVGGNATNTSGCEMVFDSNTNSLNFVFK